MMSSANIQTVTQLRAESHASENIARNELPWVATSENYSDGQIQCGKVASLVYNCLTRLSWLGRIPYISKYWYRAWFKSCNYFSGPVRTTIHGRRVIVNYGHTYPVTNRICSMFNAPLLELVLEAYSVAHRPLTLVDVGANIGDTILLVESNCPGVLQEFYCVDADAEFFGYLRSNLSGVKNGALIFTLLSSSDGKERNVVRTQNATASAQGAECSARTLDSVLHTMAPKQIDIIKIDVDGLDGKVLLGAQGTLMRHKPAVIFEWHPILCQKTSNNWTDHFVALKRCGYTKFLWFNKRGEFSHFWDGDAIDSVDLLAKFCLSERPHPDWHYDVIALHATSLFSPLALAQQQRARARASRF